MKCVQFICIYSCDKFSEIGTWYEIIVGCLFLLSVSLLLYLYSILLSDQTHNKPEHFNLFIRLIYVQIDIIEYITDVAGAFNL